MRGCRYAPGQAFSSDPSLATERVRRSASKRPLPGPAGRGRRRAARTPAPRRSSAARSRAEAGELQVGALLLARADHPGLRRISRPCRPARSRRPPSRASRRARELRRWSRTEADDARRPPHAPAELVQLRQLEPLRAFDDHRRSRSHVDPDLISRGRTSTSSCRPGMIVMPRHGSPNRAPVRELDAAARGERPGREAFGLGHASRRRSPRTRRRSDTCVHLSSHRGRRALEVGADARARPRPRGTSRRLRRAAARRWWRRRGPRTRSARACAGSGWRSCRGGAAAAVRSSATRAWRCSTPKRCCSSTTSSAEAGEAHRLLEQRVRADGDSRRARRSRRATSRRERAVRAEVRARRERGGASRARVPRAARPGSP